MKLYRKRLDSLEALKREKIRLRYERRHTNVADLNPLSEMGRSKLSGSAKTGALGFLMELASSGSNLQTALTVSKPILQLLRKRKAKTHEISRAAGLPPKKSIVKKAITEIAVGYIIGKAIQMAVRGVQQYIRRRKAKKVLHK